MSSIKNNTSIIESKLENPKTSNDKKIIDCFGFYNELDLLNYRLNLLYDIVDYFILVESTHTFVGNKKELYFNNNKTKYDKFLDKIIHIIVEDMPLQFYSKDTTLTWKNENHQRICISRGINQLTLKDNDIIIISDLDEISNPELIINKDNILITEHSIPMDLYWYNLHRVRKNEWIRYAKILTYKNYLKYNNCHTIREAKLLPINYYKNGWHLSYFGDVDFIHNKLNNFAHQEKEVQSINNIDEIKKRLQNGEDLSTYNRDWKFDYISISQNENLPAKYDIFLEKYYNSSKIHFITYADEKFSKSKARILKEAEEFGEFSTITGYGPEDLDDNFKEKYKDILNLSKTAGYGIWKPYIIKKKLEEINKNDILIYLDAGCTINLKGKQRFYEYINMFNNTDKGIISFQMNNSPILREKNWTTKEVFNYFNILSDSNIANSGQILNGIIIMKINKHLFDIINTWYKVINDNVLLFTDYYNINQESYFIDSRRQSISSIIQKKGGSIILNDETYFLNNQMFGKSISLKYPFWATRIITR